MLVYYEVIKINIKNLLVYRLDTAIGILGNIFSLFVQIYLWTALFHQNEIAELSLNEMITYQVFGILLGTLYNGGAAWIVGQQVRDGSIAMELIKPYNYSLSNLAASLASSLTDFVLKGLPVLVLALLTQKPFLPDLHFWKVLLLMAVILCNIVLFWLMHFMIGLLHFSLINAGWFSRILADVIRILGGGIIPLWFFPGTLKSIFQYLPFQLLYQFPQSILINKITNYEIARNGILLLGWTGLIMVTVIYMWRMNIKKLVVQGG